VGTNVTWTATASGGTSPLTYAFYVMNGSTNLLTQWYGSQNSVSYTFSAAGSYYVTAFVQDASGNLVYQNSASFTVQAASSPLTISSVSANKTSPQPVGTNVTWTATASGGTSPLTYAFYVMNGSTNLLTQWYGVGSLWAA
jgi:hypothetical protein